MMHSTTLKDALLTLASSVQSSDAMKAAINELWQYNPKLHSIRVKTPPTEADQDETLKRLLVGKEQIMRRDIVRSLHSYAAFRRDIDGDPVLAIHRAIDRAIARGDLIPSNDAANAFTIVEPY